MPGLRCVTLSLLLLAPAFGLVPAPPCQALTTTSAADLDSDHDGLSDALEQSLLDQFAPRFSVGPEDCSNVPALFQPGLVTPTVAAENGTVYGQVFPAANSTPARPAVEVHFYHLWRIDCGPHGHNLDTEHVAVLLHASGPSLANATWKADYWYAAAHENTVCDVSQIARASTLDAVDHGARVWISPGKHASYLNEALCQAGCGADHCERMTPLHTAAIVNLGEAAHPMNGSVFIASKAWPLEAKMTATNFAAAPLARLEALPANDIAWYTPGRHPSQQIIAVSSHTEEHLAGAGDHTGKALATANGNTGVALSLAEDNTGNALSRSFHNTTHALGTSARHVGHALGIKPDPASADNQAAPPPSPSPQP